MEILGQGTKNEGSVKMMLACHHHILRKTKKARTRERERARAGGQNGDPRPGRQK